MVERPLQRLAQETRRPSAKLPPSPRRRSSSPVSSAEVRARRHRRSERCAAPNSSAAPEHQQQRRKSTRVKVFSLKRAVEPRAEIGRDQHRRRDHREQLQRVRVERAGARVDRQRRDSAWRCCRPASSRAGDRASSRAIASRSRARCPTCRRARRARRRSPPIERVEAAPAPGDRARAPAPAGHRAP